MGGANTADQGFQTWKSQYAPKDSGSDYDLRGAYEAGLKPDPERGHFPDTFKMTNHPTFSVESKYSTPEHPGGTWGTDVKGRDTFTPSPWMASDVNRMSALQKYFSEREPNATLIIPKPTTIMGGAPTAKETYQKFQSQLPAQKVGYGVGGEMLAKPTPTPAPATKPASTPNFFGRDASKPLSSEDAIETGLIDAAK